MYTCTSLIDRSLSFCSF